VKNRVEVKKIERGKFLLKMQILKIGEE